MINQSKDINNKNKSSILNTQAEFDEELEDQFYYEIPIKDFKKKSQLRESDNYFSLKREEMTPQNQTQNFNNNYYQGINNTNTHSNLSNTDTNNQFNFSKNNVNYLNNFNFGINNYNNNNNINKEKNDKNKREIIEDILRNTQNGSFLAKTENERPYSPPFTKLIPTNNLSLDKEKINTSSISKENLVVVNPKNIIALKKSININNKSNLSFENNIDLSKIEEITNNNNGKNINIKTNGNLNLNSDESKNIDKSYLIKDVNYMDLIYDHVLGYYFDPKTNVYYELMTNKNNNINEIINQD
jgi:hypothetical protein